MKQLFAFVMALVLVCGLCACGRKPAETEPTTAPSTMSTTAATTESATRATMPTVDPTLETNIPDPSVDTTLPDMTELMPTDGDSAVTTDPTTGTNGSMQ